MLNREQVFQKMKSWKRVLKRIALVLAGLVLIYFVFGYALLYWFMNQGSTGDADTETAVQSGAEQMRSFAQVIHFSRSIVERSDFDPCASVCSNSSIAEWPEDAARMARYMTVFYKRAPEKAMHDPRFNFAVLIYFNLGDLFPKRLLSLLREVEAEQGNAVSAHPLLAMEILMNVPVFLKQLKKKNERVRERTKFIDDYKKILYQCRSGTLKPTMAIGLCRQQYDLWRGS